MKTKTKKALFMLLVVALISAIAVGGMLAYLTDRDSAANVFTLGDVKIDLTEEFEQGATLTPGVKIEKEVKVVNEGKNDAWVWVEIAIPKALDGGQDASKNVIHFNYPEGAVGTADNQWSWLKDANGYVIGEKNVDGIDYNVYTVLYNSALAKGTETAYPAMSQVYMDTKVDIDTDGKWYLVEGGNVTALDWDNTKGNPIIYVNAYAIQEDTFENKEAAYAAYYAQWGANGGEIPTVEVEGNNKAALVDAINDAKTGDTIVLTEDTTVAGYAATEKLIIDKAITIDLNDKTLTTESGWGGIDAKGGCSIKNGTINHTGNTAAIKAFQVKSIENVTINVTETAGKTKGGIVVQEGPGCYVGSIKNVTINGATNGIETYRCGERSDLAIGSMEDVTINATDTGISLSAPVGTAKNCNIEGDKIGINMYLYGPYSVSLDLVNSTVTGETGIYAHDEAGKTNPGSLTLTYDDATVINGGITQEFETEVASRVSITKK